MRPRLEMGRAALAIKYQELREVAENCADKLQRLGEGMSGRTTWGWWGQLAIRWVGLGKCQALMDGTWADLLLASWAIELK